MKNKKKKVAIIGIRGIPANYGGFETCAEETAVRLAKTFQVYVFCRKHISNYKDHLYKKVHLLKLPSIKCKSLDTISHTFICSLYLLFKPDIRIIHLYNTGNAVFIPLLRLFRKKVIVSVDGLEWKRLKWGCLARKHYRVSESICAKFANRIIADSRVIQKYYLDKFGVSAEYIPYGADINNDVDISILEKYKIKPREYLLFVGRLVPEKGVHNLIWAYNQLAHDKPLVIIGNDPVYRDYIRDLKNMACRNVLFLGFKYGKEYRTLNKYPYLYVTASRLEGTSPALVTAMGAGNCVLVNGIPENMETVGEAGFFSQENNDEDLRIKLQMLLDTPQLVEEYRQKAAQHVQSVYNWDVIANQYSDLMIALS